MTENKHTINDENKLQTPIHYQKEWHCQLSMVAKYLAMIMCLFLFCFTIIAWFFLSSLKGLVFLITIIVVIMLFIIIYHITNYQAVKFTPHYIKVDNKKIDISQLAYLKFVKYRKGKNSVIGVEFLMRFKPGAELKKDIRFIMRFGGFFTSQGTYNYTDRFIKIVWSWAEAKSKIKSN